MSRAPESFGQPQIRRLPRAVRVALALVAAVLVATWAVRVWYVNAYPPEKPVPVEHYAMGEWVDLDGTYLFADYQSPQGYSVRVNKAELLTPREYLERYGAEGYEPVDDDEGKSVVSLEVEIEHVGDGEVGLVLFEQRLIPERKNVALHYDMDLWGEAEPALKGEPGIFALRPDSTYVAHIPFTFIATPDLMESYEESPRLEIADAAFEYLLSNEPVKKVVDIVL